MKQSQQGDVLYYSVDSIPPGAKKVEPKNGKFMIALGEATGHAHVIEAKPGMECYELDGILYLSSTETVPMTHEEHHSCTVEPGITAFEIVREKDHFQDLIRKIVD